MALPQLLVAYDAECPFCRSVADWAGNRDKRGLIVFFPIQNLELLRMAPELGGLPLHETIHGMDVYTRKVFTAGEAWMQIIRRIPGWRWCARFLSTSGLSSLAKYVYKKRSAKHCRVKTEWR